jgi:hypothetical protein
MNYTVQAPWFSTARLRAKKVHLGGDGNSNDNLRYSQLSINHSMLTDYSQCLIIDIRATNLQLRSTVPDSDF